MERQGVYTMIEKSVKDWAYTIYYWVRLHSFYDEQMIDNGYRMEVMDLEEIRTGDRVCHECSSTQFLKYSFLQYAREYF